MFNIFEFCQTFFALFTPKILVLFFNAMAIKANNNYGKCKTNLAGQAEI